MNNSAFVSHPTWRNSLQGSKLWLPLGGVLLIAAAGFAVFVWPLGLAMRPAAEAGASGGEHADDDGAGGPADVVQLTPEKLAAAGLHTSLVGLRDLQATITVPGRIDYNAARHLEMKAPVDCTVKQVLVTPGQQVKLGDQLAVLTSSEVGLARYEVAHNEADLGLAQKDHDWISAIAGNLPELLALLKQHPELPDVETTFKDKVLGTYRDTILSAYSKLSLAEKVAADTHPLGETGAISTRTMQERRSAREIAAAAFQSVCERSQFECSRQLAEANHDVEHATLLLAVSREKLQTLLGPFADVPPVPEGGEISTFVMRAPFDGRVQDRLVVNAVRVTAGQAMFVLANTDTLWVSAQIHEREWNALAASAGQEVVVRSPAMAGQTFTARVQFVGPSVSAETRAVSLVAELDNAQHVFKPGMFVWVTAPVASPRQALAVPPGAIMRHESQAFVFVEEQPGTYRRVDVTTGLETPDYIEITAGLTAGLTVVDHGAFFLKSESLLETLEE